MKVTEIFYSVQGEGVSIGLPAVFIRTSGCNLAGKCPIPCDTEYSWKDGEEMSHRKIMKKIEKFSVVMFGGEAVSRRCNRVVITGGEPLLQKGKVGHLVETLKSHNYIVEVETNGTIPPPANMRILVDLWNVSPKFITPENIYRILGWHIPKERLYLKFVIDTEKDLLNLLGLQDYINSMIEPDHILLMPQSRSSTEQLPKLQMMIEYAKSYGYRVTPRLQILAYENARGK